MGLEQYQGDMAMCCRCSTCKFIPMQMIKGVQYANVCPSIAKYNYHAYSGGGRLNIAASMLKNGSTSLVSVLKMMRSSAPITPLMVKVMLLTAPRPVGQFAAANDAPAVTPAVTSAGSSCRLSG